MSEGIDSKKLTIAYHETGHAVMALLCHQVVRSISLKEMDSPRRTDKYLGFTKLEPVDPNIKFTGEKAIQRIMIALAGGVGEGLFSGNLAKIALDDMERAIEDVEKLVIFDEFKDWVAALPVPPPDAFGMITNPLVRTYIVKKVDECFEIMIPLKPLIQLIAEELYKREELTGDEVSVLFDSFMHSSVGLDQIKRSSPIQ